MLAMTPEELAEKGLWGGKRGGGKREEREEGGVGGGKREGWEEGGKRGRREEEGEEGRVGRGRGEKEGGRVEKWVLVLAIFSDFWDFFGFEDFFGFGVFFLKGGGRGSWEEW